MNETTKFKGIFVDRFEIAVHFKNQRIKRKAFHFPETKYAGIAVKYIEYSVTHDGICIADNVPAVSLDSAIIEVSKIYNAPIIVDTESKALMFSISHSHRVYSLENLPNHKYVICYNCIETQLPPEYNIVVTVFGHRENIKFV